MQAGYWDMKKHPNSRVGSQRARRANLLGEIISKAADPSPLDTDPDP